MTLRLRAHTPGRTVLQFPVAAAFGYPWYDYGHWNSTKVTPVTGTYENDQPTMLQGKRWEYWLTKYCEYAGIDVLIMSWWGPSNWSGVTETGIDRLMDYIEWHANIDGGWSGLKVAVNYELDVHLNNPTTASLTTQMANIYNRWMNRPSYAWVRRQDGVASALFYSFKRASANLEYQYNGKFVKEIPGGSSTFTGYSSQTSDNNPATWGSIGGLTSSDYLYVAHATKKAFKWIPTVIVANTASVSLNTPQYWNGTVWTNVTAFADNTSVGGKTLAQSGEVDLFDSVPGNWATNTVNGYTGYFIRMSFSGTLSTTVDISESQLLVASAGGYDGYRDKYINARGSLPIYLVLGNYSGESTPAAASANAWNHYSTVDNGDQGDNDDPLRYVDYERLGRTITFGDGYYQWNEGSARTVRGTAGFTNFVGWTSDAYTRTRWQKLIVLRTQDNLATVTDYTGTAITLNSQDTAANGDYLYIGCDRPFGGVQIKSLASTNSNASVLSAEYWNETGVDAWTALNVTDTTASGGVTLANAGYWTWPQPGTPAVVPDTGSWLKASLVTINDPAPGSGGALATYRDMPLYWARVKFSAVLDASVATGEELDARMVDITIVTSFNEHPEGTAMIPNTQDNVTDATLYGIDPVLYSFAGHADQAGVVPGMMLWGHRVTIGNLGERERPRVIRSAR